MDNTSPNGAYLLSAPPVLLYRTVLSCRCPCYCATCASCSSTFRTCASALLKAALPALLCSEAPAEQTQLHCRRSRCRYCIPDYRRCELEIPDQ